MYTSDELSFTELVIIMIPGSNSSKVKWNINFPHDKGRLCWMFVVSFLDTDKRIIESIRNKIGTMSSGFDLKMSSNGFDRMINPMKLITKHRKFGTVISSFKGIYSSSTITVVYVEQ